MEKAARQRPASGGCTQSSADTQVSPGEPASPSGPAGFCWFTLRAFSSTSLPAGWKNADSWKTERVSRARAAAAVLRCLAHLRRYRCTSARCCSCSGFLCSLRRGSARIFHSCCHSASEEAPPDKDPPPARLCSALGGGAAVGGEEQRLSPERRAGRRLFNDSFRRGKQLRGLKTHQRSLSLTSLGEKNMSTLRLARLTQPCPLRVCVSVCVLPFSLSRDTEIVSGNQPYTNRKEVIRVTHTHTTT